ncbi:MAG: hypothetical protein ACRBM6_04715 [Geminicoccales bacterium]
MAEERSSVLTVGRIKRSLDLDVSAILIAERLVGGILGWDKVDWSVVESHRSRRFSFGRQRQDNLSIHDQLKPFFDRCDPGRGDFSALKPSPAVNHNLSNLVRLLCCHIGGHSLPGSKTNGKVFERTIEQERLHQLVIDQFLCRVGDDPVLDARAARLKAIAAAAENELEKHFADLINDHLEKNYLPDGVLDSHKHASLRDQARNRVEAARALNARELAGLSTPHGVLDAEALIRTEMAKILLGRFPYMRNYELMLLAELAMLQRPLAPRFVPDRMLSSRGGVIDAALIEQWDDAISKAASRLHPLKKTGAAWDRTPLQDRSIAICGSGPLPLSALFLHLFAGTKVILIDQAPVAIDRSRRLISNLERLDVIAPGALTVREHDAGRVCFYAPDMPPPAVTSDESSMIACDAVMIASLVDSTAKTTIADQVSRDPNAPDLLIMRSATGLSAKLAYDTIPTQVVSRRGLAYCGEALPATQVATRLDRIKAIRQGVACITSPDVLAIAHPDVVNTTEVYRKIPRIETGTGLTIEDWMEWLQLAGQGS